jgi:hypothetical protein
MREPLKKNLKEKGRGRERERKGKGAKKKRGKRGREVERDGLLDISDYLLLKLIVIK